MGSFDDIPMLLTVEKVSELTGMHPVTIRRGLREERIPGDKIDGKWFVYRDAILPKAKEVFERAKREGK
ncbi:MAG: helix-turn-helix domain-containing protein [Atopobiaceae bacterium]|nr:helix-turn-helix domain-containing protein [Atopobiaceae bacterium]